MIMKKLFFFIAVLFLYINSNASNGYTVTYQQLDNNTIELSFDIADFQIDKVTKDGFTYTKILFDGSVFTNKKGYARLPYVSSSVMLSPDRNVEVSLTAGDYIDVEIDDPLLPSRGIIYRDQDPSSIPYKIDPASIKNEWYPGNVVKSTDPFIIRDIRGTSIYVYPFQYNAANGILRFYKNVKIQIKETEEQVIVNPLEKVSGNILSEMDALYKSIFINYNSQRDDLTVGDYGDIFVICTERDSEAIEPYITWKKEKGYNVEKEIVSTGSLVKDLIQGKYDENSDLLYVLLVGDWGDIKSETLGYGSPMDPQLGCVIGEDEYPDITVGRFSAQSPDDVAIQVNKTINYEKYPEPGASWYKHAVGIASNQGPGDDNELDYEHNDVIYENKLSQFTYTNYTGIYDPSANTTMVKNAVEEGTSVINYTGHGSPTSWGTSGFSNSNVAQLQNESKLPVIVSVACNNGDFHNGECFAEAWLKKEGGGAVMMLAATISQPWDPPMRGQDYFMDILTGGYDYELYPDQNGITTTEGRNTVGSFVFNGLTLMVVESDGSDDWETSKTWTLFGDPSLQMRTDTPAEIALSNDVLLTGVPFTTTVTSGGSPVSGAVVAISDGVNYYSSVTDVAGVVTIEHELEPGSCKLVVTGFNLMTTYMDATVIPPDGPYLVLDGCVINDESGNSNGEADYSEEILLNYTLKNVGIETAPQVAAYLSSSDPYVTINSSEYSYGDIPADETMDGSDFSITVSDSIPDNHMVTFSLEIHDSEGGAWTHESFIYVNAPSMDLALENIDDTNGNGNGRLDPGETADISILAVNLGHAASPDAVLNISSTSEYITINTNSISYNAIPGGESVSGAFNISVSENAVTGSLAVFDLFLDAGHYSVSKVITLSLGLIMEDWESAGFTSYFWEHNGNAYWSVADDVPYEGEYCVKSGNIADNQTSELYITVEVLSDGDFSFYKKVSSEANYDYLNFYIDGEKMGNWAGNVEWSEEVYELTAGTHSLKWEYKKDYYVSSGLDCAWIDYLIFPPIAYPVTVENVIRNNPGISLYPNPGHDEITMSTRLEENADISITVYNAMGQIVYDENNLKALAGEYQKTIGIGHLKEGMYYYHLRINDSLSSGKFLKKQ